MENFAMPHACPYVLNCGAVLFIVRRVYRMFYGLDIGNGPLGIISNRLYRVTAAVPNSKRLHTSWTRAVN